MLDRKTFFQRNLDVLDEHEASVRKLIRLYKLSTCGSVVAYGGKLS